MHDDPFGLIIIGVVIQTAVLALAIVASHVKTRERITTLEAHKLHLAEKLLDMREEHNRLEVKVMGISRHVEHLETIHHLCPYWHTKPKDDAPEGSS